MMEGQKSDPLDDATLAAEKRMYDIFERYRERLWEGLDESSALSLQAREQEVTRLVRC
jgi:hypothetical protein